MRLPHYPEKKGRPVRTSASNAVRLEVALHGASFVACAIGGVALESVLLLAGAAHHLASVGSALLASGSAQSTRKNVDVFDYLFLFIAMSAACLLLVMRVAAQGIHGLAHAEPIDIAAVVAWALPGVFAALATGKVAWVRQSSRWRRTGIAADTLLSAAPAVLALIAYLVTGLTDSGKLDAAAGLGLVLVLFVRSLLRFKKLLE
ncbi:hypothetical protein [Massilia sp. LjRoot122]|uniref:hypothetical protein n=1 Tax=Massilia sp. LjRoot122 TaxID=3342257 RepID=UPI003ECE7E94